MAYLEVLAYKVYRGRQVIFQYIPQIVSIIVLLKAVRESYPSRVIFLMIGRKLQKQYQGRAEGFQRSTDRSSRPVTFKRLGIP